MITIQCVDVCCVSEKHNIQMRNVSQLTAISIFDVWFAMRNGNSCCCGKMSALGATETQHSACTALNY